MITDLIRSDILVLDAPKTTDVPDDFIKLDAMESPYQLPSELQNQLAEQLANAPVNRYPIAIKTDLVKQLRETLLLPENTVIALGNGSDELIQFLTILFAKPNAVMLAVEPSFIRYQRNAQLFGMQYIGVPLNSDFSLNTAAILEAITQHNPALIFIAYPNNPTGVVFNRADVETIVQAATGLVVIDEAYGAFHDDSFATQEKLPENVLVLQTLSKIGFAGLRLGYAMGNAVVIDELNKILPQYNMNQLSLITAKFALQHIDVINQNIEILKTERDNLSYELNLLEDVEVFPSQTNFITVRLPSAQTAFDALKQNKILVKNLHGTHPLLDNTLCLTIGLPEENAQVLRVLRDVIDEHVAMKRRLLAAGNVDILNSFMMKATLIYVGFWSLFSIMMCMSYF